MAVCLIKEQQQQLPPATFSYERKKKKELSLIFLMKQEIPSSHSSLLITCSNMPDFARPRWRERKKLIS